jgi:hypothetical protein
MSFTRTTEFNMATREDVRQFIAKKYKKPAADSDKMKEVVKPADINSEADILAGHLGARFKSSISGDFIKADKTVGQVCDETIAKSKPVIAI